MQAVYDNETKNSFSRTDQTLAEIGKILTHLRTDSNFSALITSSSIYQVEITQLILQFRIDTQSALAKLLQIEHGLLNILGINPNESATINIERMKYALGNDDLKNLLHRLSQLVNALLITANRYQQNLKKGSKQKRRELTTEIHLDHTIYLLETEYKEALEAAILKQTRFILTLDEIINNLNVWEKQQPSSEKLQYIVTLRDQIPEYVEKLFQHLEATYDIYGKLSLQKKLDQKLSTVLLEIESLVKQLEPIYQPAHFFTEVKATPSHRLEERAAAKRLSNFFNH